LWVGATKNINVNATNATTAGSTTNHTHNVTARGTNSSTIAGGTNTSVGDGDSHTNMQPYITCYMWKRTV